MSSPSGRMRVSARVGVDLPGHERLLSFTKGTKRAAALGVWTAATCMSRLREQDGFCALEWIEGYATAETVNRLVEVGLFALEERAGIRGVRVLRYDEFNETKEQIEKRLQQDRLRKKGGRASRSTSDSDRIPVGIQTESGWTAGAGDGTGIGDLTNKNDRIVDCQVPTAAEESSYFFDATRVILLKEMSEYAKMAPIQDVAAAWKKFTQLAIEKKWHFDSRGWEARWMRFCDAEVVWLRRARETQWRPNGGAANGVDESNHHPSRQKLVSPRRQSEQS